jgi:hypothetical protein
MLNFGKFMSCLAVLAVVVPGTAWAEDKIVATIDTQKTEGGTTSSVNYVYADCEEECFVATVVCSESTAITLVVGDVKPEEAAKAITSFGKEVVLKAGGKSFNYMVSEMQFMELTGGWWLDAFEQGSKPGEIAAAIAAAKTIEISAGGNKKVLPVDGHVKDWAKACK